MEIESKEHLETLYDIVRDTWELFQQDFEGDPGLELSSNYEDLLTCKYYPHLSTSPPYGVSPSSSVPR